MPSSKQATPAVRAAGDSAMTTDPFKTHPRLIWSMLALLSASLVVASLVLVAALGLHPCHLCIFQRVLFMKLAALGGLAAWQWRHFIGYWAGLLTLPVTAIGIAAAGYQSWLQAQPTGSVSCVAGDPNVVEQVVEWLGRLQPDLFLATGFCENAELSIMGLTLANWALVAHVAFLASAILTLRGRVRLA
jgi:disulfide bond formation protein DsbB